MRIDSSHSSALVRLPLALREEAGGASTVAVACDSVDQALSALSARYPTLRRHLFDETGALRAHVNVFVNRDELRTLDGIATRVRPGDEISIVPSIAGG
jgi:MoaD family protein